MCTIPLSSVEPLRIGTDKGWKKFEITIVAQYGGSVTVIYPDINQSNEQRVQYVASMGFKPPWDNSFQTISKVCCS